MTIFSSDTSWACLFPGIGVNLFGREKDFFLKFRSTLEPFLKKGSKLLGEDFCSALLKQRIPDNSSVSSEIFTYAFSCGTFIVFEEKGLQPKLMAGHSLGIYAALVSADCLSFEDGLRIIMEAHRLGRKNCTQDDFGAVVIIGLDHDEIRRTLLAKGYTSINLANLNNDTSGVYVGYESETSALLEWADNEGAIKTIKLGIDIPYHNPRFMTDSSEELHHFLQSLSWKDPRYPILSALDHRLLHTGKDVLDMTAANLSSPIHWPGLLGNLNEFGVDLAIECGAGVSLSQHSRFIDFSPYHYNLRNFRRKLEY